MLCARSIEEEHRKLKPLGNEVQFNSWTTMTAMLSPDARCARLH
jgi:hypothetical protein